MPVGSSWKSWLLNEPAKKALAGMESGLVYINPSVFYIKCAPYHRNLNNMRIRRNTLGQAVDRL